MKPDERGETLLEVVVAVGIASIALGAIVSGTIAVAHKFGPDPVHQALEQQAKREMRVAIDVLKYQGSSIQDTVVATTIPQSSASPLPAHLSIAVTQTAQNANQITVTAQSDADPSEQATLNATVVPAPLPQSTVQSGLLVPAPLGAQ